MTTNEIKTALNPTVLSFRKGVYTAKWSYFYSSQAPDPVARILAHFPNAKIVDNGNHFHGFVGGAQSGGPQDSYKWAKFTIDA